MTVNFTRKELVNPFSPTTPPKRIFKISVRIPHKSNTHLPEKNNLHCKNFSSELKARAKRKASVFPMKSETLCFYALRQTR
jgi:hypothetical protein